MVLARSELIKNHVIAPATEVSPRKNLWYVKRDGGISGPFPEAVVTQHLILGRITPHDLLSQDRTEWSNPGAIAAFQACVDATVSERAFAQSDERRADRRQRDVHEDGGRGERERGRDRRRIESAAIVQRRAQVNGVWQRLDQAPVARNELWLLVFVFIISILGVGVLLRPSPIANGDCSSAAVPGVNWESCTRSADDLRHADLRGAVLRSAHLAATDLAGANLARADFAYADLKDANLELADLSASRLLGADLRRANLAHSNLRAADLQFADLRAAELKGADLTGALLGNAIWSTGQRCSDDSVGTCRTR